MWQLGIVKKHISVRAQEILLQKKYGGKRAYDIVRTM